MDLAQLGWAPHFAASQQALFPQLTPARVCAEFRGAYRVVAAAGEFSAKVDGKFRHAAVSRADYPTVGDWVACSAVGVDSFLIHGILPRRNCVARRAAGTAIEEQLLAANVDTMFLVSALNAEFNPRRVERYVALAVESQTEPVIVLNKADLCPDLGEKLAALEPLASGIPLHVVAALHNDGLDTLARYLTPGRTVTVVGSSGVGKSTLINALLGEEALATAASRAGDDRGRHTTTARQLVALPGGALLLDTPGMRELHLWAGADLGETFGDIKALARRCRFRDCRHQMEPGCAVRAALGTELDAARLRNYHKLERELAFVERKTDVRARAEEKQRWKAIHKEARRRARRGD